MKRCCFNKILLTKSWDLSLSGYRHINYNLYVVMKDRAMLGSNLSVMAMLNDMGWHLLCQPYFFGRIYHEAYNAYAIELGPACSVEKL